MFAPTGECFRRANGGLKDAVGVMLRPRDDAVASVKLAPGWAMDGSRSRMVEWEERSLSW